MQASYNGTVEGRYTSLPWGDVLTGAGSGSDAYGGASAVNDAYHFAALDHDYESNTDHAQFRTYSPPQGRWLSPDPYDGSYDIASPQSFNRYAYVANNPLSFTDPSGQDICGVSVGASSAFGNPEVGIGVCIVEGILSIIDLSRLFGGPKFHGTLSPRPSTGNPDYGNDPGSFGESNGIGNGIKTGSGSIANVFGLPNAGCEFGSCGAGPSAFGPGDVSDTVTTSVWLAQFGMGLNDILSTYGEMKRNRTLPSDKYYHCIAMANASMRGPGGEAAAVTASWGREISDTFKYRYLLIIGDPRGMNLRDSIRDSKGDLMADYTGINGGFNACTD